MKEYKTSQSQRDAVERHRQKNKDKAAAYQREYRKKNREAVNATGKRNYKKNRDYFVEYRRDRYRREWWVYMNTLSRRNAKKAGVEHNLTSDYLKSIWPEDNKCPILGLTFEVGGGMPSRDRSASLDRIIPSLGYIQGNVQIISFRANRIKNDSTLEELKLLVAHLEMLSSFVSK